MRSKRSFIHVLSLVLCMVLLAGLMPTVVRAEEPIATTTVDKAVANTYYNGNIFVYANGEAIVIEESGVYVDANRDGIQNEGDGRLCAATKWTSIYGGTYETDLTCDVLITMNGGNVGSLHGGNRFGGTLTGNVKIVLNDGTVDYAIFGSSQYHPVDGNSEIIVNGGQVKVRILGAGEGSNANLSGSSTITVNGGNISNLSSGSYCQIGSNFTVNVTGGTIGRFSPLSYSGTVTGNVTLNATAGTIGSLYCFYDKGNVGKDVNIFTGENVTVNTLYLLFDNDRTAGTVNGSFNATILSPNGSTIKTGVTDTINNLLVREANGNWIVKGNVTIPADSTLTIPAGYSLTIPEGATLTNEGTIVDQSGDFLNDGAFINKGNLSCNPHTYKVENDERICKLCGYVCPHESWNPATCMAPETCAECGKEYGEKLPHSPVYAVKEGTSNVLVETCEKCDTHHVEATLTAIDKTYTGSPITDAASISYGDGWLGAKPVIDASCYSNHLNATTEGNPATVEVTLEGKTLNAKFSIVPATIGNGDLILSSTHVLYNGQKQEPSYFVSWNGMSLNPGTDYDLSWDDDSLTNADTYTLTVVGKGNFQGTATAAYTITKADPPEIVFPTVENEITYGQPLKDGILSFYENEYGTFNWNAADAVPYAGTAYYAVDFIPYDTNNYAYENYTGGTAQWIESRQALCQTVGITVNKAEVPVPSIASKPYSGTLQTADIPESRLYTITNEGGTDAGEYPVTLALTNAGNYKWASTEEDTLNLTFAITQAINEGDISIIGWTYGEDPNVPACGSKFGEPVIRYTGTAVDGTEWDADTVPTFPGSYKASFTVAETENYTGLSKEVEFTIAKAPITVTADDTSKVYGEDDPTLSGSITAGQVVQGDTLGFTYSRESGSNVGTYIIKASANAGNVPYYDVTFVDGTFTIGKAPLTIIVEDQTITYGEKMGQVTVNGTGFQYDDNFIGLGQDAVIYPCDYEQFDNVGTYAINTTGWESDNYTISYQPGTLTVVQKEIGIQWSDGKFVYSGEAQAPTATATGTVNNDALTLTVTGAKTEAGKDYEATVTEIKGDKAGNYKLPADVTKKFEIGNADQTAPKVTAVDETISKKADGKLTGLTSAMEYRKGGQTTYTKLTGTELAGLTSGKYYVRYSDKTNYNASPDAEVVIKAGRKLTVTLPSNQDGYTVTASATELDWHDTVTITYLTADGYTRQESFCVKVNGKDTGLLSDGIREFTDVEQDLTFTVTGVMDMTAPTATITLKDNWNKLWSGVTFGRFFNETQTFTITAEDAYTGSGLDKIYYYLSETEIKDVQAITNWTEYTMPVKVNPDKIFVIYAKATDKAGNTVYVNSDGFVLDATAPAITGIENGKDYYGDTSFSANDDNFSDVTIDGKTVTLTDGSYTIKADNRTHVIVATDKAGNRTTFTIRVYQIHTVTFVADGKVVATVQVNHGADVTLPTVPAKTGYSAKWNKDGKNILTDTTITAVYKALPSPNSPQTGDNSNIFLWIGLMLVTALCLAALAYKFFFAYKPKYQDK